MKSAIRKIRGRALLTQALSQYATDTAQQLNLLYSIYRGYQKANNEYVTLGDMFDTASGYSIENIQTTKGIKKDLRKIIRFCVMVYEAMPLEKSAFLNGLTNEQAQKVYDFWVAAGDNLRARFVDCIKTSR